jgi:hypothetical protein
LAEFKVSVPAPDLVSEVALPVITLEIARPAGVNKNVSAEPRPILTLPPLIPELPVRAIIEDMVIVAEASDTAPPDAKTRELIVAVEAGVGWVNLTLALVVEKSDAYSPLKPAPFNNLKPLEFPTL